MLGWVLSECLLFSGDYSSVLTSQKLSTCTQHLLSLPGHLCSEEGESFASSTFLHVLVCCVDLWIEGQEVCSHTHTHTRAQDKLPELVSDGSNDP